MNEQFMTAINLAAITPERSKALASLGDHLADVGQHFADEDEWAWRLMASLARQISFAELMMRDQIADVNERERAFAKTLLQIINAPEVEE